MLNHDAVGLIFHALGDATRRNLLERLGRGPLSISALASPLNLSLAAVVQHVQVLEESGIVTTQKVGRVRSCRIRGDGLRLAERWIAERRCAWEERFDRLGDLLEQAPPPAAPKRRKGKP